MSLINQMLRDLEERRAAAGQPYDLQREIRPLPQARGPRRWPWLAAAVALAAIGVWGARQYASAPPDNGAGYALVQSAPDPATPIAVTVVPQPNGNDGASQGLRLSLGLRDLPPEPRANPVPATAAETTAVAKVVAPPVAAQPPAPAAAKEVTKDAPSGQKSPVAEGTIEKTVAPASARERAEVEFRRAQAALSAGRTDEAGEALNAALRQDAAHVPARQALIRMYLDGRRTEAAEAALREGLEAAPTQIGWAMTLARLQVERNDLPGANATLSRYAAQGARNADYLGFFGHVQQRLGLYREAAASYQAAVRLAAGDGRWWLGLGLALEADGQTADAREAFRRALAAGNLGAELAAVAEHRLR